MDKVLYSHPGKPLEKHLSGIFEIGRQRLEQATPVFDMLRELDISLELINKVLLISHDFGKANRFFQRNLWLAENKPESDEYQRLRNDNKSNHGLLSAFYTYYILQELSDNLLVPVIGFMVVNRHHGNLKNLKDNFQFGKLDWLIEQAGTVDNSYLQRILEETGIDVSLEDFSVQNLVDVFTHYKFRRRKLKELSNKTNLNTYYLINLLYSILIFSDKAEVIFAEGNYSKQEIEHLLFNRTSLYPDLVDRFRKANKWDKPQSEFDKLRNEVYQNVMGNISTFDLSARVLSLNVPTGIGKTAASYSAALKLRERLVGNYRIIYTLPFTSVIDQNYKVMKDILELTFKNVTSDFLIKHHYLTEKNYESEEKDNISYNLAEFLIESWNSEIVISTFVQFLESILSNNNRRMKKYNSIAKSIIVMDEVQSIPHEYWLLVKEILKDLAYKFDCYIIFVTATMPLIFNEEKGEILELARKKEKYFQQCERIKLDLRHLKEKMTLDQFKEILKTDIKNEYPQKSFLFIFNTIKSSIEIYKYIREELKYDNVIYLSKNIINKELLRRINKIKNSEEPLIVVSTQLVEAGVDIDFDRVYRDFAPMDSINQSCGRCNRNNNGKEKGTVKVFKLADENNNEKLYASYVYNHFLLNATNELLENEKDVVSEKDFFNLNKKYFTLVDAEKSNDQSNDLLKWIKSLQYKKAFEDRDNKNRFKLIDHRYDTIDLFIPVDDKAEDLWYKYEELDLIESPWERKKVFEEFKEKFLGYVVTVSKYNALKHFEEEDLGNSFNYVYPGEVDHVYDEDTGFIQGEQIEYFI